MSKRIYSLKREKSAEFPLFDGSAWYKEISDQEFNTLAASSKIRHANGRFFATSNFSEALAASEGLAPTNYSYGDPYTPPDSDSKGRSGGLYSNPGATLKGLATLIFILGIIASVILAFTFGYTRFWGYREFNAGLFFVILIGGVILSYLSGLGLAAFGDLVLSANEIKRKLK